MVSLSNHEGELHFGSLRPTRKMLRYFSLSRGISSTKLQGLLR